MPLNPNKFKLRPALGMALALSGTGTVSLVSMAGASSGNPYEYSASAPTVVLNGAPAINIKQISAEQARSEFGAVEANYYRVVIAAPPTPDALSAGLYAVINFSNDTEIVAGVLERIDYKLSGLITLTINTTENVPFEPEDVL